MGRVVSFRPPARGSKEQARRERANSRPAESVVPPLRKNDPSRSHARIPLTLSIHKDQLSQPTASSTPRSHSPQPSGHGNDEKDEEGGPGVGSSKEGNGAVHRSRGAVRLIPRVLGGGEAGEGERDGRGDDALLGGEGECEEEGRRKWRESNGRRRGRERGNPCCRAS
jgi:hypothetical protein